MDIYIPPACGKAQAHSIMYVFLGVHESSRELYLRRHAPSTGQSVRLSRESDEDDEMDARLVLVRL